MNLLTFRRSDAYVLQSLIFIDLIEFTHKDFYSYIQFFFGGIIGIENSFKTKRIIWTTIQRSSFKPCKNNFHRMGVFYVMIKCAVQAII